MRDIKFRAKRIDNREWVVGDLNQHDIHHGTAILQNGVINNAVILETVGQYTGLKDKNGKEIYEGDVVAYIYMMSDDVDATAKIEWCTEDASFVLVNDKQYIYEDFDSDSCQNCEVIGNIHDNSTLLDG